MESVRRAEGGMTQLRVPAIACDHGWEQAHGCPAIFSTGVADSTMLLTQAAICGWTRHEHPKGEGYSDQHFCPKHPTSVD
jgi:hypothetical protein